ANIVGQPVGGLVGAAQDIGNAAGGYEGTNRAGAVAAAALAPFSGLQQAGLEQAGQRVAAGLPALPNPQELAPKEGLLSPLVNAISSTGVGQALGPILGPLGQPLPGTENFPPLPTAFGAVAAGPHPEEALATLPGL